MKIEITLIVTSLLCLLGNPSFSISQGWLQLEDFPGSARDDGSTFTINSIAYCGTGLNGSWIPTNDFYAFDKVLESWTQMASLNPSDARQYAVGFASTNYGYIFGGVNGSGFLNDLWKYDPVQDSWIEVTSLPSLGRSGAACFVIEDTAYIIGGRSNANLSIDEVWAYSMTADTWTQKNNHPDSLWRSSAIALQGKGYVLFGLNNGGYYNNYLYEYDPESDSWSQLANFPGVGRTYSALALLNNELTMIAGRDSLGNCYNDMWTYNVSADSWSMSYNLPAEQRRGGLCFYSNTAVFYTTGIDLTDTRLKETWKFDVNLNAYELESTQLMLYPNPAVDYMHIALPNSESVEYRIYSISGQLLIRNQLNENQVVDLRTLETGNYLIEIQSDNWQQTKRFGIY